MKRFTICLVVLTLIWLPGNGLTQEKKQSKKQDKVQEKKQEKIDRDKKAAAGRKAKAREKFERAKKAQDEAMREAIMRAMQDARPPVERGGRVVPVLPRGSGLKLIPPETPPKKNLSPKAQQDDEETRKEKRRIALEKAKERRKQQLKREIEQLKQFLNKRDIEPTKEGIRKYLLQITDDTRDWSVAEALIVQLSSPRYSERTMAQEALLKLPEVPIKLLQEATKSRDREQAFRARMILKNAIPMRRQTLEKTFRAIELLKFTGLAEELFATTEIFREESTLLRAAKKTMGAVGQKQDIPFLTSQIVDGEHDSLKDIAIYALRLLEDKSLADQFHKWARDIEYTETLRLEAALALADIGDRRSMDVLVDMMETAKTAAVRSRSSLAMRKFTDQSFKFSAYEDEKKRADKIKKWRTWIADAGPTTNLRFPLHSIRLTKSHLNGHTLLAFGYKNKVAEYDEGMNEIWSYDCQGPWSAEKMANGNYLIAEYRKNRVIEVSPDKKVVREFAVNGPLNVRPLDNGNYLISSYSQRKVLEVDPEGKTVWQFTGKSLVPDAVRLENGNTLIAEYQSVSEVNPKGERVWELTNKDITGLNQVMGIQGLENGNVLITSMAGFVVEIEKDTKKEVWRHNCSRPSDAFRLENGNTLITESSQFIEVDRDGKKVWSKSGSNYGTARR